MTNILAYQIDLSAERLYKIVLDDLKLGIETDKYAVERVLQLGLISKEQMSQNPDDWKDSSNEYWFFSSLYVSWVIQVMLIKSNPGSYKLHHPKG